LREGSAKETSNPGMRCYQRVLLEGRRFSIVRASALPTQARRAPGLWLAPTSFGNVRGLSRTRT
jgi:hypothetical protein